LGCGSDDATTNKDSGALDGVIRTDTQKDLPISTDTMGPDVSLDQAQGSEVKPEVLTTEAGSSEAGLVTEAGNKDVKPVDVTPIDTKPGIDVTSPRLDGGTLDTGTAVDSGAAVDGGAVDGGSVG
jgi:hypothetical protein